MRHVDVVPVHRILLVELGTHADLDLVTLSPFGLKGGSPRSAVIVTTRRENDAVAAVANLGAEECHLTGKTAGDAGVYVRANRARLIHDERKGRLANRRAGDGPAAGPGLPCHADSLAHAAPERQQTQ